MELTIDADEVKEAKADERGRINLGTKYANRNVRVAIQELDEE